MTSTQPLEHVSFDRPDEVREGDNWRLELLNLAGGAQPPGHDAWVVGDEPVVAIDWQGASVWAARQ
jgi:hypothetical protein